MVQLCLHVANVFYLFSFLGRDILWLRVLTCGGLILGIVFFSCQPMPLYGPVVWHIVFLVINVVQIRRLIIERRELRLTAEQERLAEQMFRNHAHDELLLLLTRVMCENPGQVHDLERICRKPLTPEERALRDIAFSRLSRQEVLNLLTRRMWNFAKRQNPWKWRRRRRHASQTSTEPGIDVARSSAT